MSFFELRRQQKQTQINNRNGSFRSKPAPAIQQVERVPLISEIMTNDKPLLNELTKPVKKTVKSKYVVGDTKIEIIENIIENKPSIKDLKQALKEYVIISQEEFID